MNAVSRRTYLAHEINRVCHLCEKVAYFLHSAVVLQMSLANCQCATIHSYVNTPYREV